MADIALHYHNATQAGDLLFSDGDISLENPLREALLISLFSDRLAPDQLSAQDKAIGLHIPGNALHATENPRKGWWGDMFGEGLIGSRLWQLQRVIVAQSNTVLLEVEAIIYEALEWLITDNVVVKIDVNATWSHNSAQTIHFSIAAYQPTGPSPENFQFSLAWQDMA
ncbi:phage GP46 family protein [Saccharibacter floricola]|uniref:Mu-like prophage protein gp46 n=1 Tax=Saccharibacter floricola DSM 15669 TaxID=1123227 RepID=A0ABQ0P0Q8_9PROT|nr:phage GP46 family protein [Saccharibacter floricola]GBQ07994.1 Mu-like prophage protein gp46 [Saccharibacter floricola DSM 15669]